MTLELEISEQELCIHLMLTDVFQMFLRDKYAHPASKELKQTPNSLKVFSY